MRIGLADQYAINSVVLSLRILPGIRPASTLIIDELSRCIIVAMVTIMYTNKSERHVTLLI